MNKTIEIELTQSLKTLKTLAREIIDDNNIVLSESQIDLINKIKISANNILIFNKQNHY